MLSNIISLIATLIKLFIPKILNITIKIIIIFIQYNVIIIYYI
jgi:hypothetical protein